MAMYESKWCSIWKCKYHNIKLKQSILDVEFFADMSTANIICGQVNGREVKISNVSCIGS